MIDISTGITLFNDSDFFSAHDFFEDIWIEVDRSEKAFFQGMVQISVGCYHLISGNLKGAKSQLNKGITKLRKFEPVYYNVNLNLLNNSLIALLNNLDKKEETKLKIPIIELIN